MSVARTGLPHTGRTTAAEDGSGDRTDTAANRSSVAAVAAADGSLAARPQLPHPTAVRRPATAGARRPTAAPGSVSWSPANAPPAPGWPPARSPPRPGSASAAPTSCCAPSAPRSQRHDPAALPGLWRRPRCRHRGDVPAGTILAACRCLDCDPTSACARCEYRQYLQASGGRDYANEQRVRWGLPLVPRPDHDPPATQRSRPCPAGAAVRRRPARPRATTLPLGEERHDRRFGRHGTVRSPVETCPRPRSRGSRSVPATTTIRPARARTGSPGWWLGS
jgi:hypothetical protein